MAEITNDDSMQSVSAIQDDVLHSQVARVRTETTTSDGRPEAFGSEDVVTNDNMLAHVGTAAAVSNSFSAASLLHGKRW